MSLNTSTCRRAVMNLALRSIEALRAANSMCIVSAMNRGKRCLCANTFGPEHADTFRCGTVPTILDS